MSEKPLNAKSRIARLVWILAGIGVAAGLVTLGLEYRAIALIRARQLQTRDLQRDALDSFTSLQAERESVFAELDQHLIPHLPDAHEHIHDPPSLYTLLDKCEIDLARVQGDPTFGEQAVREMRTSISSLDEIHQLLIQHEEEYHLVLERSRRASERVFEILSQIQEAAEQLEGHRRLRRALMLRHYNRIDVKQKAEQAIQIVDTLQGDSEIRIFLSELRDMEILVHRLQATEDMEQLVSLKDNQMRQTLTRLRQAARRTDESLVELVNSLQKAVFGRESRDDPAHQTMIVGQDGLYRSQQRKLQLADEDLAWGERLFAKLNECIEAEQKLNVALIDAIDHRASQAQVTLQNTWRDSLTIGIIIFITFIVLAWKISRLGQQTELNLRTKYVDLEATMSRLEEATEEAQAASRAKDEFLANMSHEIRTPMTAILGFTDTLLDQTCSEREKVEAAQTIQRNGDHLLQIINSILDMSKIESGQMTVENITTCPARIVQEVTSLMGKKAGEKGLELSVQYETPVPDSILSDPVRLRQILLNLVDNAIKFTREGEIRILVACDTESRRLEFVVVDTGDGMTPEQLEYISRFEAFRQADGSMTRRFGGTGLGLAISKRLAALLGGDITVTSRPNEGSTFTFTLATGDLSGVKMVAEAQLCQCPMIKSAQPSGAPAVSGQSGELSNRRLLLAEDGPDNQRLLSFILRKAGAELSVAANGRIALALHAEAVDQGRPFDLVLMDMQMPELDGYEATRRLREMNHRIPVIALTAHAMEGDREKCMDVGCNDYLTKPVNKQRLIETCCQWIERQEGTREPLPTAR